MKKNSITLICKECMHTYSIDTLSEKKFSNFPPCPLCTNEYVEFYIDDLPADKTN